MRQKFFRRQLFVCWPDLIELHFEAFIRAVMRKILALLLLKNKNINKIKCLNLNYYNLLLLLPSVSFINIIYIMRQLYVC